MTEPSRSKVPLLLTLCVAAAVFLTGIGWGLPSRAVDPFLFGDEPVWPGEKIARLAPKDSSRRGADVDANPIAPPSGLPIELNATDEQRAEIIRRYRLFSYQPDEMITLKSLSLIRANRGDPRLYQYGGLWIYPVGAMLGAANVIGFLDLRGDQTYYLDHPEAFGRFYIVARFYAALWGLVGTWAVFWIVRRLTSSAFLAAAGASAFACMPVVVAMSHEAKPHLPGLSLTLLAAIAASRYTDTGRRKWALLAGLLCGAAFGMVLSGLTAFAILPAMVLLRPAPLADRLKTLVTACLVAGLTYVLTNPFVAINALFDRELLQSNLGNSTAMYRIGVGGFANALRLIVEGASPAIVIGGVIGLVALAAARIRRRLAATIGEARGRADVAWVLAAPAALVAIQFVILAHEKPPEYARFALLPNTFLLVAAFAAMNLIRARRPRATLAAALTLLTMTFGLPYLIAFVHDSRPATSRLAAAQRLREPPPPGVIVLSADPAPYVTPAINLFRHRLLLVSPRAGEPVDPVPPALRIRIEVDHAASPAPISWADVRFRISPTRPAGATTVSSP